MYSDSRDNMDDPDVSFEFSFTISTLVYLKCMLCKYAGTKLLSILFS